MKQWSIYVKPFDMPPASAPGPRPVQRANLTSAKTLRGKKYGKHARKQL